MGLKNGTPCHVSSREQQNFRMKGNWFLGPLKVEQLHCSASILEPFIDTSVV
jgi:hypothetical protein